MVETMLLFLILPNMACVIQLLKIPTNQTEIIIYRDKKMKRKKRKFAINVMSLAVIPIPDFRNVCNLYNLKFNLYCLKGRSC